MTAAVITVAGVALPLSGVLIAAATAVGVFVFLASISFSYWLLDATTAYCTDPDTPGWHQLLLFVPWIALTLWCMILHVVVAVLAIFIGYTAARAVRDWWHAGK